MPISVWTSARTLRSSASVGTATPGFSGRLAMTTRFRSVIHSRDRALTSSRLTPGRKSLCRSYSYWMPGVGSPSRKARVNSSA